MLDIALYLTGVIIVTVGVNLFISLIGGTKK